MVVQLFVLKIKQKSFVLRSPSPNALEISNLSLNLMKIDPK